MEMANPETRLRMGADRLTVHGFDRHVGGFEAADPTFGIAYTGAGGAALDLVLMLPRSLLCCGELLV